MMKYFESHLIGSLLFILSLGTSLPVWAHSPKGVVNSVKGKVFVVPLGKSKMKPLQAGQKVYEGDALITKNESRIKVTMLDRNVLNLSQNTFLTIQRYEYDPRIFDKNVRLKVEFGELRTTVNQRYDGEDSQFLIITPTGVANVKGTDFVTAYDPSSNQTKITTLEGSVSFNSLNPDESTSELKSVTIKAGQSSFNSIKLPPQTPKLVSASAVEALKLQSDPQPIGDVDILSTALSDGRSSDHNSNHQDGDSDRSPASVSHQIPAELDHSPVFDGEADLGTAPESRLLQLGPELELTGPPPTLVEAPPLNICEFCDRVIEDGNTRVLINLVPGSN